MNAGRFAGARVLITGGSRNIGRAITERFAAEGAHVAINTVVEGEAEELAGLLRTGSRRAIAVPADVSDPAAVEHMLARVESELGGIDVLVNNAAVPMLGRVPFFDLTLAEWDRQFAVGARGTYLCTRGAAERMVGGGSIINISSIGATKAHREAVAYDATKGAIEAFTRAAALELAPHRIRVNAIAPGAISNARYQGEDPAVQQAEVTPIPLGRAGTGGEVAGLAAYLASPEAAYITGQVITIDGGLSVQARQATAEIALVSEREGSA
ncbi:SDR family NAD(P)-dependent oxidoreductase [Ruania halotolerans]|uniref:SDR family NAD(P)-dependent oxidoreductase n=1 Tax=Ruania halotolerans TaxID=2897773 RepID=UPI001E35EAA3|nr:SDR family NAD(P)-dependent oxidoreductase [Ruania halotolerans]UFU06205.1 SDR family oxidoreductase [Ruania halotolerans]